MTDKNINDDTREETSGKMLLTRRRMVKGSSLLAGASLTAGAGMWYGAQPAIAGHLSAWGASDLIDADRVESDDGTVIAVNTAPSIDLEWANFANGADSADVTLTAHLRAADNGHIDTDVSDVIYDAAGLTSSSAGSDGVSSVTDADAALDGTNTNGGVTITLDLLDITDEFDADLSGETEDITETEFEDSDSSTANQITTVELQLETTVNGAQSANPTANVVDTFDVEVENLAETQTTGGTANTSAE